MWPGNGRAIFRFIPLILRKCRSERVKNRRRKSRTFAYFRVDYIPVEAVKTGMFVMSS